MMAAMATPLTRGRVHGREDRGSPTAAHAAPNKGSAAGAVDTLSCLANCQKDNGRDPNLSSDQLLPIYGGGRSLLAALGLGSLGHCPLQGRPAAGVERVDLLPVAVLAEPGGTAGGGVEGAQLRQALFLGRERGLQGFRQLGVVHRHDPEPCFQLQDFDFSPGEFEIDGFGHCHPFVYGSKLLNEITTPQEGKLCLSRPRSPWQGPCS